MIETHDLEANFSSVLKLREGVVRCVDETPKSKYFYYLLPAVAPSASDLLLVSENYQDDQFAERVLASMPGFTVPNGLEIAELTANGYGFTHLIFAPPGHHQFFKGILDSKRSHLVLCVPIFRCEISGNESAAEFLEILRRSVSALNWSREISPKIVLRFDNPRTGGGTVGEGVVARWPLLLREFENLSGVQDGFIEFQNWQGRTMEVLSPKPDEFTLIADRIDATRESVDSAKLISQSWAFLTAG